jgi:hypothetical protein
MVREQRGVVAKVETPLQAISRDDLQVPVAGSVPLLVSVGELVGVGMVAIDQTLRFGPTGLTIVYGQNASGKSSYVRSLKVLARTVDTDCLVRGNVYANDARTTPSALVVTEVDRVQVAARTSLERSTAIKVPGLSVFDSTCAELYVDAQNDVQYIPSELRLLARLAATQDQIRRDLLSEKTFIEARKPSFHDYPPDTAVGRALFQLSGSSGVDRLRQLAAFSDRDEARRVELAGIMAAAAASTAKRDAAGATREARDARTLADGLAALGQRVCQASAKELRDLAAADIAAREAVQAAAQAVDGSKIAIGTDAWKIMWSAATSYAASLGQSFPPTEDALCPLCQQPVSADAASLLAHFAEYVSSAVQAHAEGTAHDLAEALVHCDPGQVEATRTAFLEVLAESDPGMWTQVEELLASASEALSAMCAAPSEVTGSNFNSEAIVQALRDLAVERERRAADLLDTEDPERLAQVKGELADLDARARLKDDLDVFVAWQAALSKMSALAQAHSALATNRITTAQRELSETAIGGALQPALKNELEKLSCTHLPIWPDPEN